MKFPPWWGYGYFLELHNLKLCVYIHTSVSTASGGTFLTWITLDGALSNLAYKKQYITHVAVYFKILG